MSTWKLTPMLSRDPDDAEYMARLVAELGSRPKPPRPTSVVQAPSTLRNLSRDPSQDAAWINREIPRWAQVATSAEDMQRFERKITPDEYLTYQGMRHNYGNSFGQSESRAQSQVRRTAAASAFTCSPPAELTDAERARIAEIAPYTPPPPLPPQPTFSERHFGWLKKHQYWYARGAVVATLSAIGALIVWVKA